MKHPYYGIERVILQSLWNDYPDWEIDEYQAKNPKINIAIWIANERGYMRVCLGPSSLDSDRNSRKISPGKNVMIPIARWRYRLWKAVNEAKSKQMVMAIRSQMKKIEDTAMPIATAGAETYEEVIAHQQALERVQE